MGIPNPNKSRTWDKNTPNDGVLLDVEFNSLYANDNALQSQRDADIANLQAQINALTAAIGQSNVPLGAIIEYDFPDIPSGFQIANGQAVSRTTYSTLWAKVHRSVSGMDTAANRIQSASHGLTAGQLIKFSFTGGGVTANTSYYVINPTSNDFQISLTSGGTAIVLIANQTGDLITHIQYGFGDGSSTFALPDRRGVFARGAGLHATRAKAAGGNYNGGAIGFEGQDAMQGHFHAQDNGVGATGGSLPLGIYSGYYNYPAYPGTVLKNVTSPVTDGTNGIPRTGNETAPASTGVQYIVRVQ
ncbi:hypothetical protein LEP1GSC047_1725 [Leptospira inadai serovar Lyme str. 10]|uniref:Tail fiber protein n=2 Tax=Leptospira inadai serovar Lyme TaxID=293084 RepID=V6H7Q7_9LEPT|nr:hypothetical protein [Leptospira inadai]EQA34761.1 hypothetical protein LEP1GSC047_1725 [Leptospira inadai serovar Lyme str. 10]PNV76150.1 phage tail protein [Leptospira inadai serovar Lyme]